jgi:uncharacterized membrane protein YphA (DoxX/SURF4 family)
MQPVNFSRLIQIALGLLFLIPGIFKLISPAAFTEYLTSSPVQIPGGVELFYPITFLEIIGALLLIFKPIKKPIIYPAICLMYMGILVVAMASVVIPEGTNAFPDQQEMAALYQQAHPEKLGVNKDIFPSKIGLINILSHLLALTLLGALVLDDYRKMKAAKQPLW